MIGEIKRLNRKLLADHARHDIRETLLLLRVTLWRILLHGIVVFVVVVVIVERSVEIPGNEFPEFRVPP